ncbi:atos homolog protein A-like [Planococcus citri]|uniref:atos homolog protein A-like n=1 Tax=Planococcus citri TaxID=170843 RepID=UPI0031F934F3
MHCANLDGPVKGATHPSPQRLAQQLQQTTETKEEENLRLIKSVLDAGILILEGRLPEPTSKRGYVEGPHCVLHPESREHQCDLDRYMCQRAEKYRQLMSTLWNEYKGICIELRICANCECGEEQVWKNTSSNFDHILEQWCFELTNVRNEDEDLGIMNWHGLMQAIRSQIHFSQLSAWWSSNSAQLPKNITYHVLPLSQADANSCSLQHKFPVLSFTTTYLQVKLRSQPRSETLPNVHCPVHCNKDDVVVDDRMKITCDRFGKHHCQAVEDLDENDNETWCDKHKFVDAFDKTADHPFDLIRGSDKITSDVLPLPVPIRNGHTHKHCKKKCSSSASSAKSVRENEGALKRDLINGRFNGAVTLETNSEPRISIHRARCYYSPSSNAVFILSSQKNLPEEFGEKKLLYSPKTNYLSINQPHVGGSNEDKKFDLSAGKLAEETTTQFFNICNWTNTMVSSVVSKMRNGNSFLNNLPDPNSLSDFFTFSKPDSVDKNCVDKSGSHEAVIAQGINFNSDANNGHGRINSNCESNDGGSSEYYENKHQCINAIANTITIADTNCKINNLKSSPSDSLCNSSSSIKMEMNLEETRSKAFRNYYKPSALHEKNFEEVKLKSFREKRFHFESSASRKRLLPFVGNVIESVLSGRVHFTNCIENFKIKVTCGGSFGSIQNSTTDLPAAAYYYHFGDGILSKSYLVKSFIPENEKGIQIPSSGRLQIGIFNTEESLIKVFTVSYDLTDMPRCTKTFLRHSNYFTPKCSSENNVKWLQSFLQLKCRCSKSGRLYLQSEINAIMFQKSDLNTACEFKMKTDLMHQDITEIAYKTDQSY